MQLDFEKTQKFYRRSFVLGGIKLTFLGTLLVRLGKLQLFDHKKYKTLADGNRIQLQFTPPKRGLIFDRQGKTLAKNKQSYQLNYVAEKRLNLKKMLREVSKYITLSDDERKRIIETARKTPRFMPIVIKDNLEWEEVLKIEVNINNTPGAFITTGYSRYYPLNDATSHILGYVALSEEDANVSYKMGLPNLKSGRNGLERMCDKDLYGQPGCREVEVNASRKEVRELKKTIPVSGKDLSITIDAELQRYVAERIAGFKSGAVVVMETATGFVRSLVSLPGFDPNMFMGGLSHENWTRLRDDPYSTLTNKCVSGLYAPGSTFKMITALAALEAGVIKHYDQLLCKGTYKFGNKEFHCWKKHGHGKVDIVQAIAQSCNTYFYEISVRTGIDRIAEMARRFGFGNVTSIELPNEKKGTVPDKNWKMANLRQSWHQGETVVGGIGQGYWQVTPLQLATMTARIANKGKIVEPRLLYTDLPFNLGEPIGVSEKHLNCIIKGMNLACKKGGTAWYSGIRQKGYEMGGKTGTAQVKRITKRERELGIYKNHQLPWHRRDHAIFVGYAPIHDPKLCIAVVLEHAGGGAANAAPVGRDVMLYAQRLEKRLTGV